MERDPEYQPQPHQVWEHFWCHVIAAARGENAASLDAYTETRSGGLYLKQSPIQYNYENVIRGNTSEDSGWAYEPDTDTE